MAEEMEKTETLPPKEESKEEKKENGSPETTTTTTVGEKTNASDSTTTENSEEITKLEASIIRQIEYYFSDTNMTRDKFLQEKVKENEEGWVPFTVLLTFKRLAALSTDVEVICDALNKSDEGLVEISEDRTKIRRHPERPLQEIDDEARKEISSRTAYAKGFPLDSEMSDLIEYFNPFEKVVNIHMRKYLDKPTKKNKFKGSLFVTFAKKEQCEEFIKKEKVEYKGTNLIRKWQEEYFEEKREERALLKKNKQGEVKFVLPKGSVLHFEGASEKLPREDIREALEKLESGVEIAYIDFSMGDKSGYVRMQEENTSKTLFDKLEDGKIKVGDTELKFRVVTDDEETEFLKKVAESMQARRKQNHGRGGNRKRKMHGSGGGGSGNVRARLNTNEEPPEKKSVTS